MPGRADLNATLGRSISRPKDRSIASTITWAKDVQHLMAIRFGNVLFEPLWRRFSITSDQPWPETRGAWAGAGPYYDQVRCDAWTWCRNHLMQLLVPESRGPPSDVRRRMRCGDEKLRDSGAGNRSRRISWCAVNPPRDGQPSYRDDAENPEAAPEAISAQGAISPTGGGRGAVLTAHRRAQGGRNRRSRVVFQGSGAIRSFPEMKPAISTPRSVAAERRHRTCRSRSRNRGRAGLRLVDVPAGHDLIADALGPRQRGCPDAYERLIMDVIRANADLCSCAR